MNRKLPSAVFVMKTVLTWSKSTQIDLFPEDLPKAENTIWKWCPTCCTRKWRQSVWWRGTLNGFIATTIRPSSMARDCAWLDIRYSAWCSRSWTQAPSRRWWKRCISHRPRTKAIWFPLMSAVLCKAILQDSKSFRGQIFLLDGSRSKLIWALIPTENRGQDTRPSRILTLLPELDRL